MWGYLKFDILICKCKTFDSVIYINIYTQTILRF